MGMILGRDQILGANDLKFEDVPVPQWGGSVRVRVMSGLERDAFRAAVADSPPGEIGRFSATLLSHCIVDEAGARLFSVADVGALQAKCGAALDLPTSVAMRLNGLGGGAQAEAEKNSGSGQSDDSGSGLPSPSDAASGAPS